MTETEARLKKVPCPKCGKVGFLRQIIYGLPNEDFDFENNISGGCLVGGDWPNIGCKGCGWRGIKNPYTDEIIDPMNLDFSDEE